MKFLNLRSEIKRIIDSTKDKSDARKFRFGMSADQEEKPKYHHKELPKELMDFMMFTVKKADDLHLVF